MDLVLVSTITIVRDVKAKELYWFVGVFNVQFKKLKVYSETDVLLLSGEEIIDIFDVIFISMRNDQ